MNPDSADSRTESPEAMLRDAAYWLKNLVHLIPRDQGSDRERTFTLAARLGALAAELERHMACGVCKRPIYADEMFGDTVSNPTVLAAHTTCPTEVAP